MSYIRDLARELISRDLKVRYKRSYLGVAWSLMNPLSQIVVFSFLFRSIIPLNIPQYTTFLFIGILAWNWFSAAVTNSCEAVTSNPELVRRPGFPTMVLPVITVVSNGVQLVLALPLLLIISILDGATLGLALFALPLLLLVQFFFTLALAYIVASSHVSFRDTQYLLGIFIMLAFYLTPVFYSSRSVPEGFQIFFAMNPMSLLIENYRSVIIDNKWPNAASISSVAAVSGVLMIIGVVIFNRLSIKFAEEL